MIELLTFLVDTISSENFVKDVYEGPEAIEGVDMILMETKSIIRKHGGKYLRLTTNRFGINWIFVYRRRDFSLV